MRYGNAREAIFRERPNRFEALVELDGRQELCHVKNTGRCRELLVPGATVILTRPGTPGRKTAYDLIAVLKGSRLINMDSMAPNRAAAEYLPRLWPDLTLLRPETVHGDSRFDFYAERPGERRFIEVKGVTLEEQGVVRFPDAPTERGRKHLRGLAAAVTEGFRATLLFVVQMDGVSRLEPNDRTDSAFGQALRAAAAAGVDIRAVVCTVTPDSMTVTGELPVVLGEEQKGRRNQ